MDSRRGDARVGVRALVGAVVLALVLVATLRVAIGQSTDSDPVLPEQAAGWAPVTVVLTRSADLAKVQGAALEALGSWVLAGGALAVVITRPEDLRMPALTAMLGGEPKQGSAGETLLKTRDFWIAPDPSASPYPTPYPSGSGGS